METVDPRADIVAHYRKIEDLLPSDWTDGYIQANGIEQHYYRSNSSGSTKPPVILLHGMMEGALAWLRTARVLGKDYDLIMPDARGHGLSARVGDGGFTKHLPEDTAALIRALTPGGAHVVGFSQGGSTGVFVADRYPELVWSLVAAGWADGSQAGAGSQNQDIAQNEGYMGWFRGYLAWLEGLKTQSHEERMVAALSQIQPGTSPMLEDDYVAWIEDASRLDLDFVRQSMSLWRELPEFGRQMTAAFERVACPVLQIKSGFWPVPGAQVEMEEQSSERANVRIVRFVNAGHEIHREAFEPFVTLVQEFLATARGPRY